MLFRLSLFSLFLFMSCKVNDCPDLFEIPATVTPLKAVYNVGDTITISSKFYKYIKEVNLNETYNFESTGLRLRCGIVRIDTLGLTNKSVVNVYVSYIPNDTFKYRLLTVEKSNSINGFFNFERDSFFSSLRLITLLPGSYCFSFGSVNFDEPFPCICHSKPIYSIRTSYNNDRDNNLELLNTSPDSFYHDMFIRDNPGVDNHRGYCFKVEP